MMTEQAWGDPGDEAAFAALVAEYDATVPPVSSNGHRPTSSPAGSGSPPLQRMRYRDLRAQVRERGPRRYLLRGVWLDAAYGVHAAETKAQKSWNAADAAVSVASGTAWLGLVEVDAPGPVLMYVGEGDDADIVQRVDAIAEARGLDPDALDIDVTCRVPHLTNPEHLQIVANDVREVSPRLVILDPLYLAARGAKLGDLYGMGEHLEGLQHICQQARAALMVVTHYNRKQGRGAMRITGAGPAEWGRVLVGADVRSRRTDLDTGETTVIAELDIIGGSIADRRIRVTRRVRAVERDDPDSQLVYAVDAEDVEVTNARDSGGGRGKLSPAQRKLLDALRDLGATELAAVTQAAAVDRIAQVHGHGLTREHASRELNALAGQGLVDGAQPTRGAAKLWWLLPAADDAAEGGVINE